MGDLDIFFNTIDFGEVREFVISDGNNGVKYIYPTVVWDTEILKRRGAIAAAQGVFFGDVCVYMKLSDLPRLPLAGEIIYSPENAQYQILKVTVANGVVELDLQQGMSQ